MEIPLIITKRNRIVAGLETPADARDTLFLNMR